LTNVLLKIKVSSTIDCHLVGIILLFRLMNWNNRSIKLRLRRV